MDHYLIIARSITQAQRLQSALKQFGITSRVYRAPRDLVDLGCAYAVQIPEFVLPQALTVLHQAKLGPVQIYLSTQDGYREAVL